MRSLDLVAGSPVVLHLHSPKEKLWGVLVSMSAPGIVLHGLDLEAFEDWTRQVSRGEEGVAPCTFFFPLTRVLRMDRDESSPGLSSCSDRFLEATGRSVWDELSLPAPREVRGRPSGRPRVRKATASAARREVR